MRAPYIVCEPIGPYAKASTAMRKAADYIETLAQENAIQVTPHIKCDNEEWWVLLFITVEPWMKDRWIHAENSL